MESREKALLIAGFAADKKAADVVVLQMEGLTSFTDYFVVCSGESTTQVRTIAEHIIEGLKGRGVKPLGVEGLSNQVWVLIDCGDVVVHVFEAATRDFYELEKLWLDAPRLQ
ncbi:MAG: ribosome silencing factor [Nitrospiraceae bacterium]|nr:ribosome silencing factor [Nitrospiraceae bacterium]